MLRRSGSWRATPADPLAEHGIWGRPHTTAVSCAGNCNSPLIPPATRKSTHHAGLRCLEMARPGLEPGTPRFSVVRSKLSNGRESPANEPISVRDPLGRTFANSILLPPIREMEAASSPNETPRPESASRRSSRPWPQRADSIIRMPRSRSSPIPARDRRADDDRHGQRGDQGRGDLRQGRAPQDGHRLGPHVSAPCAARSARGRRPTGPSPPPQASTPSRMPSRGTRRRARRRSATRST
jgi:hypothetical protein